MNPISDKNWSAGASLIAGLLLVIAPYRASGQPGPVESRSNIECLEHLEVPDYPPLARQARIQATQTVKLLLSDQATIQSIEHSLQGKAVNVERLFKEGAEKALKNSRFSKTCGGRTITLVFHYELSNDDRSLAFEPPNHFLIRSGAVYINPDGQKPVTDGALRFIPPLRTGVTVEPDPPKAAGRSCGEASVARLSVGATRK